MLHQDYPRRKDLWLFVRIQTTYGLYFDVLGDFGLRNASLAYHLLHRYDIEALDRVCYWVERLLVIQGLDDFDDICHWC
jgi:hypothetical protein